MNNAFVGVVKVADRRDYISHNEYCNGLFRIVEECHTIIDAEKAVERLTLERPLPQGEVYEAFHWVGKGAIRM